MQNPPNLVAWLNERAVPLTPVLPKQGDADLFFLKALLDGRRIVAAGEATHGSAEFFQMKHRLFRFLVTEMGYTLFGMEAPFSQAERINAYILGAEGDPCRLLTELFGWVWATTEVCEMVEWMRGYNAAPEHGRKIRFYGFDCYYSDETLSDLRDYFQAVDPVYLPELEASLKEWAASVESLEEKTGGADGTSETSGIEPVLARLASKQEAYAAEASEREWRLAARRAECLRQSHALAVADKRHSQEANELRDHLMAANVQWVLDFESADETIMLWAHNQHVTKDKYFGNYPAMGAHLRELYGDGLYVIGFHFFEGGLQSQEMREGVCELREFTYEPAKEDSFDFALSRVPYPLYFADLGTQTKEAPQELFQETSARNIGGVFWPNLEWHYTPVVVGNSYDGLIFIRQITKASPCTIKADCWGLRLATANKAW